MQMVYQIIAAYFNDNDADELTADPVFTEILDKDLLASQPTISRFWNRMDETTLTQLDQIAGTMRDIIYSIRKPECMLFDLDSTLLPTYGSQEGEAFNYHYQAHGYHPFFATMDLQAICLKANSGRYPVLQPECRKVYASADSGIQIKISIHAIVYAR